MISDICYEQICGDYWYGQYGEFKVVINKSNGYINVNKMCKDGGKQFSDWTRLQGTKELFAAYERLKASEITPDIKAKTDNICGDTLSRSPERHVIALWLSKLLI